MKTDSHNTSWNLLTFWCDEQHRYCTIPGSFKHSHYITPMFDPLSNKQLEMHECKISSVGTDMISAKAPGGLLNIIIYHLTIIGMPKLKNKNPLHLDVVNQYLWWMGGKMVMDFAISYRSFSLARGQSQNHSSRIYICKSRMKKNCT